MGVLRVLVVLLFVVCAGCRSQERPHDVVVLVIDTLRADRLGSHGYAAAHTPVLDALAARGTRFAQAYAPSSWTVPSVASLMTSRLPSQHLVTAFDSRLRDEELTIAERLRDAGFLAGGVTANWRLTKELGFAQGFLWWVPVLVEPVTPGAYVRREALAWLDRSSSAARTRRLLYLQYMEPHTPFAPSPALLERFAPEVSAEEALRISTEANTRLGGVTPERAALLSKLYDAEVAAVDAEIGLLFEGLEARGRLAKALVIVTADHGEEFLEHGKFGHGYNLFNTTVHVPLIIAGPGVPAGRVITDPVSLIDVAPTVLDLLGLDREPRFEGRSLVPLMQNDGRPDADIVLQLPPTGTKLELRHHREGLVRGTDKLLVDLKGGLQSFDLSADPGEQAPLASSQDVLHAALQAATIELTRRQQPVAEKAVVDDATREQLRALGYAH